MTDRVVIVSATARTPLGRSVAGSAAAVRAGVARLAGDPMLRDEDDRRVVTSRAEWLPLELPWADRLHRLARPAAFEALATLRGPPKSRVAAFVAISPRAARVDGAEDALVGSIREAIGRVGDAKAIELVRGDRAAGLVALDAAIRRIDEGACDLCVVGGVDSYLDPDIIAELEEDGRLRTRASRFGFAPGEASAFLVVASPGIAGLPHRASILGIAEAREPAATAFAGRAPAPGEASRPEAPGNVATGEALSAAFRAALRDVPPNERVGVLAGDLNGEPHRADEVGMTLVRVGTRIQHPPYVLSGAASWGDVGAATGPLAIGLLVAGAERGWLGGVGLVFGASDDGTRAACTLRLAPSPRPGAP